MFKSIVLHERRSDLTRAQFMEHWINVHAPMSRGTLHLHGYVCHEVVGDATPPGCAPLHVDAAVDGIAEMWFEKPDGLLTLPEQPSVKRWFSDGPNFIGRRMRFMAQEHVLQEPDRRDGPTPKLIAFLGLPDGAETGTDITAAVLDTARALRDARGVSVSTIVSHHPTTSIAGFPMGRVECVLEVLGDSPESLKRSVSDFSRLLKKAEARFESVRIRGFSTSEIVVRTPVSRGQP